MRTFLRSPNTKHALAVFSVVVFAAIAALAPIGEATRVAAQDGGAPGDDADAGERVFRAQCAMCHGADAEGMMGMHPSLRGAIGRLSREGVEVTVRQGRRTQPPMPAFDDRLSAEEIADVLAYIASLPDGPRNFGPGDDGGMMGDGGMMMDDGVDVGDVALVIVALLVVVGVAAGAWMTVRGRSSPGRLLDRRYAAGELSRDDYLQGRRDLNLD